MLTKSSNVVLAQVLRVSSLAKLWRIGAVIKIVIIIFSNELYLLLMQTHCSRFLWCDYINLSEELSIPYAANFAIIKSWGILSKAFDTSIKTAPTVNLLSNLPLHSSNNCIITSCWYIFSFIFYNVYVVFVEFLDKKFVIKHYTVFVK